MRPRCLRPRRKPAPRSRVASTVSRTSFRDPARRSYLALTAQRYRIRRRIFDTLLKRRIYHRFGASQFSGMILICFLGERSPPRSSEVDLRADERSTSRETGFRPACRTTERPRQKQVGQAPSGNRGAARQRVPLEVHREALQFFACQPRKLAEEARIQETEAVKSYGGFGTFEPLGPMAPKTWNTNSPAAEVVSTRSSKLIIPSASFDWHFGAAERQNARPLHIRSAREWGK